MKINQDQNIDAVYAFQNVAKIKSVGTVMVLEASVMYYDTQDQSVLFSEVTDVQIDTTQASKVSITALSCNSQCFCEFSTKYQQFTFNGGVLTITGTSNGQKHAYKVTLM